MRQSVSPLRGKLRFIAPAALAADEGIQRGQGVAHCGGGVERLPATVAAIHVDPVEDTQGSQDEGRGFVHGKRVGEHLGDGFEGVQRLWR